MNAPIPAWLVEALADTNQEIAISAGDLLLLRAGDETRTRDSLLGRQELYQLSYSRMGRI